VRTVLYIDDDRASRDLLARIFTRRPDLHLLTAASGAEGVQLARDGDPDLVLSDLQLADRSGLDVLVELRGDPATEHLPVVIISGDSSPARIAELRDAGAADYLTKPFTFVRLLEVVDTHLDLPAAGAAPAGAAPTAGKADAPLDPEVLADLRRLLSRPGLAVSIVEDFLTDAHGLMTELRAGLGDALPADVVDLPGVAPVAHRLAGSAGMFAAHLVAAAAHDLERSAARNDLAAARAALASLEVEVRRATTALRDELARTSSSGEA
jgi:CheY-like chemotaxis protein